MEDFEHDDWLDLQLARDAINMKTERLRKVIKEIGRLKQEEANYKYEIQNDKEDFKKNVERLRGPDLLQFMEFFELMLPRELRDMVYGYLGISGQQIYIPQWSTAIVAQKARITHTSNTFFYSTIMGATVAWEIEQLFWSSNKFTMRVVLETVQEGHMKMDSFSGNGWNESGFGPMDFEEYESITAALDTGCYDPRRQFSKVRNVYESMRHLQVIVNRESWGECRRCHKRSESPSCSPYCTEGTLDYMGKKLSSLLAFKGKQRMHIEFRMHTVLPIIWMLPQDDSMVHTQRHWVNVLESIRACIFTLIHSGVHVSITICNRSTNGYSGLRQSQEDLLMHMPDRWDLTPHLVLSTDEWAKESAQAERAHEHYITKESISGDPEGFYSHLERRWGLHRPLSWMEQWENRVERKNGRFEDELLLDFL